MGSLSPTLPVSRPFPGGVSLKIAAAARRPPVIFWIVCLAGLAHLVVTLFFLRLPIALDDMFQYDMLARSLAQGTGYRWYTGPDVEILWPYYAQFLSISKDAFPTEGLVTTFRAPGYPFFLAAIYTLAGGTGRIAAARIVQALLMSSLTWVVYCAARGATQSKPVAIFAALVMALYPILLAYPIGLASENAFIPLLALGILATTWAADRKSAWAAAAVGLLLGLAALTRSIAAPCVLVCALWLLSDQKAGWKKAAALAVSAGMVCLPWAVRNTLVLGHPAMIENSMGYNLFIGYHPLGNGEFISAIAIPPLNILDDGARDAYCTRSAVEFIRADPAGALLRVARRAAAYFGPEDREFRFFYTNNFTGPIAQPWLGLLYLVLVVPWAFTVFFAILGLWLAPDRRIAWLVLVVACTYTLPHLLIMAEPRFHLAMVPLLLPYTAFGWLHRREAVRKLLALRIFHSAGAWAMRISIVLLIGLWVWGFILRLPWLPALMAAGGNLLRQSY